MVVMVLIDGGFHFKDVVEWEGMWVDGRTQALLTQIRLEGVSLFVCSELAWFSRSRETALYNNPNLSLSTIQW